MDPISALSNAFGSILSSVGVGSKSRQNEIKAQADAQYKILQAQAEVLKTQSQLDAESTEIRTQNLIKVSLISGVLIILLIVIYLTLKKQ